MILSGKTDKKRASFNATKKFNTKLESIKEMADFKTKREIFEAVLKLNEWLLKQKKLGNIILVKDNDNYVLEKLLR